MDEPLAVEVRSTSTTLHCGTDCHPPTEREKARACISRHSVHSRLSPREKTRALTAGSSPKEKTCKNS